MLPIRAFRVNFWPSSLYPNRSNNRDDVSIKILSFKCIVSLNIMERPDSPPITILFGEKNRLKERAKRKVPNVKRDIFSYILYWYLLFIVFSLFSIYFIGVAYKEEYFFVYLF